ncbi:MAG: PLP-dependent transferase [Chloroflexi bacterium]|nr:PLP-dependent transferase [Chloroflexota bacterium]
MAAQGFSTRAVHTGERSTPRDFQPVSTPIYSSVGFLYESMDEMDRIFGEERPGYVYTRYGNPTLTALEAAVADLEGGETAVAYGTGMAAIHAAFLSLDLKQGDVLVAAPDCYGATFAMLTSLFPGWGIQTRFVDCADLAAVERTVAEARPRAVFVETTSNPLMKVADVPALAGIAHRFGARLIVDNTFATPVLFRPLEHGADLVVHSLTKYLGGHGDAVGGIVVGRRESDAGLRRVLRLVGGALGPFEGWLLLRGLKTLPLRMARQCDNAAALADWLAGHPAVVRVHYPGLAGHPQHALARRLFRDRFGAMIAFDARDAGQAEVFRFFEHLRLCLPATTLGDIYTLLLYPPHSSHRWLSPEQRRAVGIGDGLIRLSVGIEDVEDIRADLDQALRVAIPILA